MNVYVPLFWLSTTDGFQVPAKPSVEVVGKTGTTPPAQIDRLDPNGKDGVGLGVTVILTVSGKAHRPAVGVNV